MANHPNRGNAKIRETQERLAPAFATIREIGGRCMEQLLDRQNGIIAERWLLPNGTSVMVYGTPIWCDVYSPVSLSTEWSDTLEGIRRAAGLAPQPTEGAIDEIAPTGTEGRKA